MPPPPPPHWHGLSTPVVVQTVVIRVLKFRHCIIAITPKVHYVAFVLPDSWIVGLCGGSIRLSGPQSVSVPTL
jgi:hypothetical protein